MTVFSARWRRLPLGSASSTLPLASRSRRWLRGIAGPGERNTRQCHRRTIYTFFPSLELAPDHRHRLERAGVELDGRLTRGSSRRRSAAGRVEEVIDDLIRIMTDNRALTVALLRALLSGKPDVAQYVRNFVTVTQTVLATGIRTGGAASS